MFKKLFLVFAVIGLAVFLSACSKPAPTADQVELASVAQWLTDSGVKMYGAFWCPHCADQKKIFGEAFSKINYIECSTPDAKSQTQACKDAGIDSYPTWEFKGGVRVEGVLNLDQLKERSNYTGASGPPVSSS
jgi:hypothetical protein